MKGERRELTPQMKKRRRKMICPLSSRQVKYLKLSGKNTYISLWSVGIFYAHHFFLYFSIRLFSGIGYSTGMSDFSAS